MTGAAVRELIGAHPFAADMVSRQLDAVSAGAEIRSVAAGDFVFHEGRPADHCYLVLDGEIGLELHVPHRGAVAVATVGPGEILGWSWLLSTNRWRFDAVARSTARLVVLDASVLREACDADAALDRLVSHRMIATMAARLEASRHQLVDAYGHGTR